MKTKLLIVIIAASAIALLIGASGFSFARTKDSIEDVSVSSDNIIFDISSVSLFGFTVKDFFAGAYRFEYELMNQGNENGIGTGTYSIIYRSFALDESGNFERKLSEEVVPLSVGYMTENQAEAAYGRMTYPLRPFIEWEQIEYNGVFSEVLKGLQYVAYVIGMIWGVLSIAVLVLIDTIAAAWDVVRVGFAFVGIST